MNAGWLGLRWSDNIQSCAVAVLAHRLAARGAAVRLVERDAAGMRAGDYLFQATDEVRHAVAASGLILAGDTLDAAAAGAATGASHPVRVPRIAILGGAACAYPYMGYYAQSLASLGLPFDVLDGAPLAGGALDTIDVLILPGGFTNWGLDRNEGIAGIDAAIRGFLARGGACIASCGGAFYLAEGRPHWLGVARASPRYSHEYLRSGAGLVSIELDDGPLARGCAPIIEMPYYHGPIFEAVRAPTVTAAHFCALTLPARLPIDNPLDAARFTAEMAAKPAVLTTLGDRGRAVLFSPHPEMGDVVRKYIALDSYVAHYLPIRGAAIMEQTLDLYEPIDSPSFRLILNALDYLLESAPAAGPHTSSSSPAPARAGELAHAEAGDKTAAPRWDTVRGKLLAAIVRMLDGLRPDDSALGNLVTREIARLRLLAATLAKVGTPCGGENGALRVLQDALAVIAPLAERAPRTASKPRPAHDAPPPQIRALAQDLLAVELPLRYLEALARIERLDAR
jgi:hypothetical protein